jgi:hypothetical protein
MNLTRLEVVLGVAILVIWLWALAWVHIGGQLRGPFSPHSESANADILKELPPLPGQGSSD